MHCSLTSHPEISHTSLVIVHGPSARGRNNRLTDSLLTEGNQFGFKKKLGTDSCIYVLKEIYIYICQSRDCDLVESPTLPVEIAIVISTSRDCDRDLCW